MQKKSSTSLTNQENSSVTVEDSQFSEQTSSRTPSSTTEAGNKQLEQKSFGTPQNNQSMNSGDALKQKEDALTKTPAPQEAKDISTKIRQRFITGDNQQQLIEELNTFYAHLDQQPYMQRFDLKEPSKVYFSSLMQKLVHNPPVIYRETDSLFTLLQNTAHFFRILGKENITMLKGILEEEHDSFERVLKAFYGLTYEPEYLKREYGLSISPAARADYAAFFLNTIGGRLYLFRRDPTSRMVVSYYTIITIDRANAEGNGGHGIDLRPAIRSLIEEMENSGGRLRLKDEYLDVLYDLKVKYN